VRTIVIIRVEQAKPLISPAYDSGATEHEVAAVWERHIAGLRGWAGAHDSPDAV
jgi:hypothetical protein